MYKLAAVQNRLGSKIIQNILEIDCFCTHINAESYIFYFIYNIEKYINFI